VTVLDQIFVLDNQPALEPLLQTMQSLASNVSDPISQKAAFIFLSRSVSVWMQKIEQGSQVVVEEKVPGFKQFVYDNLVPTSLSVLVHPDFNIKDGLTITVC
jgi:exportin-T